MMLFFLRVLAISGGAFLLVVTAMKAFRDMQVGLLFVDSLIMPTAIGIVSIILGRQLPKQITVSVNQDGIHKDTDTSPGTQSKLSIVGVLNVMAAIAGIIGTGVTLLQFFEIDWLNLKNIIEW